MTFRHLSLVLATIAVAGCSAVKPAPPPSTGLPFEANGQLTLVRVSTELGEAGTNLILTVKNPYSEPTRGVRVVYRILVSRDADAAEVARTQTSFRDGLAPGQEADFTIALPPQAGQAGFGTFLHAFAMRVGAQDQTPPPFWRTEPQ